MNKRTWIQAAGIRAIKTIAQTAVATIGTSAFMGEVNWIWLDCRSWNNGKRQESRVGNGPLFVCGKEPKHGI